MSGCVSFNINYNETCEINTTPLDFHNSNIIKDSLWSIFEKGHCGLGRNTTTSCLLLLYEEAWHGGRDICLSGHGDLVKIASESDNHEISVMLSDMFPGTLVLVWIGLNKVSSEEFIWPDMTPLSFNKFGNGQPDTARNCVLLTGSNLNSYYWVTRSCSETWTYICERRNK
ncbi:macrophage mannose receptor 1-like [Ruditapes philippinarum]|uniref:macrophage mannose receptor 1-like n=1 Tax=Ruditapes philippinarum TaxID=129788 RepID=UPI00295AA968|nr:macrophage mannose receptor 1-like [Ruditapes philippinarum]